MWVILYFLLSLFCKKRGANLEMKIKCFQICSAKICTVSSMPFLSSLLTFCLFTQFILIAHASNQFTRVHFKTSWAQHNVLCQNCLKLTFRKSHTLNKQWSPKGINHLQQGSFCISTNYYWIVSITTCLWKVLVSRRGISYFTEDISENRSTWLKYFVFFFFLFQCKMIPQWLNVKLHFLNHTWKSMIASQGHNTSPSFIES